MTDNDRDKLLTKLQVGMVRLTTLIEEGLLRRVVGLEEAQNQAFALISGLQTWRTAIEKERSHASGEASGRAWAWGKLVGAFTAAGAILAACGGVLKFAWDFFIT